MSFADKFELDEEKFLGLLGKLIGHARLLQNNPPAHVPQEELASDEVIEYLKPYTAPAGPLVVSKHMYVPGRSNLVVTYPAAEKTDRVVSFVGMHQDVVPANPEEWEHDPFRLGRDGDKLWGRGVTDCLGHVACLAEALRQLAVHRPALTRNVVAVFIANEENSDIAGVGVDEMQRRGELEMLRGGPLYWIDSANFGPTLGTGGIAAWKLHVTGKKGHSGMPHQNINAIELAHEVVRYLQARFFADFSVHAAKEREYKFNVGSSLKPTQVSCPPGSLNQIPGECFVSGDIRFTPFYPSEFVKERLETYVRELDVTKLPTQGESKFVLPDGTIGKVRLEWLGGEPHAGVACKLDSPGYAALFAALEKVRGAAPFSLTGSLPLIRELQDAGLDVQITGFGRMDAYHANNEFAYLSDFKHGLKIVAHTLANLEKA